MEYLLSRLITLTNVIFRRMETSGYEVLANKIDSWLIWLYPASFALAVLWIYGHFIQ